MHVLLIEDNPEHADLIRSQIIRKHGADVIIEWVDRLIKGLDRLSRNSIDVILLDLGLPDSVIDKTLGHVLPKATGIPIVILSSLEDEEFGIKAVHEGAQDYINKSWMDGEVLFRALRYAIERKAAEEELRKASQAKDEFLLTLSHELRTPVNVIQGFADLLKQRSLSETEEQQAIDAILRNSKLQVSLIGDMLDMSQIITGKLSLKSCPQDMITIISDAIETVSLAARNKHISIKTFFDKNSAPILGDQVRLHQIMWNLLSNAIKFTPLGGNIIVRTKHVDSQLEVEIEDNGEGLDPNFLPYAFDKFRQQDSSIRRKHEGLGLGLAIVKQLTELHGGNVSVKSEGLGKGATFKLSFPTMASH